MGCSAVEPLLGLVSALDPTAEGSVEGEAARPLAADKGYFKVTVQVC